MTFSSSLAYARPNMPIRTPRMAEYEVIARITQRLVAANQHRANDRRTYLEAVFSNEQLWSTLAADVAAPENGLPASLKARLFYLYRFTSEHSRRIRQGDLGAETLIEVNKAVMKGLRGEDVPT